MTINTCVELLSWAFNWSQKRNCDAVMEVNDGFFCFIHMVKIPRKFLWQKCKWQAVTKLPKTLFLYCRLNRKKISNSSFNWRFKNHVSSWIKWMHPSGKLKRKIKMQIILIFSYIWESDTISLDSKNCFLYNL